MKPRSQETISYTMSRIKGKDTTIEVKLRKVLYQKGYRYRCNSKYIFGHPDISFKGYKVVVFCDSEFWHGYNFEENKEKIHSHTDYWIPKIERNIARDKEVNERLTKEGYTIIRFWGNEINKNLDECVKKVEEALKEKGYPNI
ncbi:MAG: very short patch repair endonuclease [Bacilli bacterium]|nr:very short patch repair endonuclease [Bacilli bacterium]